MTRKDYLSETIKTVCGDRTNSYGEPEDSFKVIAQYWSTYIHGLFPDTEEYVLLPHDVANMMVLFKVARCAECGGTKDTYVDMAGYSAIAGELLEKEKEAYYEQIGHVPETGCSDDEL